MLTISGHKGNANKTTLRFHLTPVRIAIIKNIKKGILIHFWRECKLVQPFWKTIWRLLKNLNIDLLYDPAIPLLGIYPKECITGYPKHLHTHVYCSAIHNSTIAKLRKQPSCPTTDEWIKKMWYLYTMEFFSAMKKNEILPLTIKWME
jgi:hypothetical protein